MKHRQILLSFDSDATLGNEEAGVVKYCHTRTNWKILGISTKPRHIARTCREWRIAGGIGLFDTEEQARAAARQGIPFVIINHGKKLSDLPEIGVDPWQCGRMAADHLAELGLKHFLYAKWHGRTNYPAEGRYEGFRDRLQERGLTDLVQTDVDRPLSSANNNRPAFYRYEDVFPAYLKVLRRPAGVFCLNDHTATEILECCRELHLRVPDDIAVLGVNNDQHFCLTADPPLSSIQMPYQEAGYEAAKMLDQLLAGKKVTGSRYLPPKGVVSRQSTDMLALEDPEVVNALRYIREHAAEGIRVPDVVTQTALSSVVLQQRFGKLVGRSLFAEIRRVQIEKVKLLLRETDMSLERIAAETGFSLGLRLNREFKHKTGLTPITYRRQFRHT